MVLKLTDMASKKGHITNIGRKPWNKGRTDLKVININKKDLYHLYIEEKKGIENIAKILDLSYSTTRNRLLDYGWVRNRVEAQMGHKTSKETREKISKSLLGNIPWNKDLTKQIDSRIKTTAGAWKKGHIPWSRGRKGLIPWNKNKKFMALDKNPNWRGGKSFEPYGLEFNNELKEKVRKRDGYRCQQCFRHQDELYDEAGRKYKLNVHHIDYNKSNNDERSIYTFFQLHHTQTNFSREDWTEYYKGRVVV